MNNNDSNNIESENEEDYNKPRTVNLNVTYPNSPDFEYQTIIEIINFDKECQNDIESGQGFIIEAPKNTNKKDVKAPNGIYSPKFGQKMGDTNPYADRYSCECGYLKSRINHGIECPICHTKCKYVDDDFKMFGWIVLKDPYHVIHPKFYDTLDFIFGASNYNTERKRIKGTKLQNMLNYSPEVDQHGRSHECTFKPDKEPFFGIGMMEFYNRFDEILDYYKSLNGPKKQDYFDEIEEYRYSCTCGRTHGKHNKGKICPICETQVEYIDKDWIFTHSIPVFTTHLRPADIRDNFMYFEPTNGIYNMINKHVHSINKDRRKMDQDFKIKNTELFKTQEQLNKLTNEIVDILSGKKGQLRSLVGGKIISPANIVIY